MVHRDLKPENMLIGSNGECIISDFGQAITLADVASRPTTTVQYAAPEDLDYESPHTLGTAADVYSFGVMLWEAVGGCRPWQGMHGASVLFHVGMNGGQLDVPVAWPAAVRSLASRCMDPDPRGRPCSKQLVLELLSEIRRVSRTCVGGWC